MSRLTNGKIPPKTPCPFRNECVMSRCYHKAEKHDVPFSCATARLFDIMKKE